MKNMIMIVAMLIGASAMAQGDKAPAAKVSKKDAKAQCLKDDKSLKGDKLSDCIKTKQGK